MSVLVLVRANSCVDKTNWIKQQILLLEDSPLYMFEPSVYYNATIKHYDAWYHAHKQCLTKVHATIAANRKSVVFVADEFIKAKYITVYLKLHTRYKLLINLNQSNVIDTVVKKFDKLETYCIITHLLSTKLLTSVQTINTTQQNIDSPYLNYKTSLK